MRAGGVVRHEAIRAVTAAASAVLLVAGGLTIAAAPGHADEPLPHRVTYSVTAQNPFYASI